MHPTFVYLKHLRDFLMRFASDGAASQWLASLYEIVLVLIWGACFFLWKTQDAVLAGIFTLVALAITLAIFGLTLFMMPGDGE